MPNQLPPNLLAIDQFWQNYRDGSLQIPKVIYDRSSQTGTAPDYDVLVCGGTLGIFLACAMQIQGWRVLVIEKQTLQGRDQEWNISRSELESLLALEVLTEPELARTIVTEFNPARIGFDGGQALWVRDILNLGISPKLLIATVKQRFLEKGGIVLEHTQFHSATIYGNGVTVTAIDRHANEQTLTGKVLIDGMGHFSPIVQQFYKNQADSICMVVGSCAQGLSERNYSDLIYTFTPALPDQNGKLRQYFWEAFPAQGGRTTYLFVYLDRHNWQLSFRELWQTYLSLLSTYQETNLKEIHFVRQLIGFFPAYKNSPLLPMCDRLLPVGDSSGLVSPLSFGGFGAMMRHLPRLTAGLDLALKGNHLSKQDIHQLLPYQPNLSVTWLFQAVMSNPAHPPHINNLMNCTFQVMDKLGDRVMRSFLQDRVEFLPLSLTMLNMAIADPLLIAKVMTTVGISPLLDWLKHYLNLGYYHFATELKAQQKAEIPQEFYQYNRYQALRYGAGREHL